MLNLVICDDSNAICHSGLIATASRWPPYGSYDVITGHENVYVNNSWQNTVKVCARCCVNHDASTDMQHDLPGPLIYRSSDRSSRQVIWPTWGQISKLIYQSQNVYFNASRNAEYNGVQYLTPPFLVQIICKNAHFAKGQHFWFHLAWKCHLRQSNRVCLDSEHR